MIFECDKNTLSAAFANVSKATGQNTSISALEGVKISVCGNSAELTAYNLSMGIKKKIDVKSDGNAEFLVSPNLFLEIVKRMPDDSITITVDESYNIHFASGYAECDISARSTADYPDIPAFDVKIRFEFAQYILKNMIHQTIFSVSNDTKKPILTGELLDIENGNFRMVALDNFKLAIRNENISDEASEIKIIVPAKSLSEVERLLSEDNDAICAVTVGDKHVCFDISGYEIYSRLLEGEFFNYRNSIPKSFATEVIIRTKTLIESLERCSLIIEDKTKNPIRCRFENGMMKLSCTTSVGKVNDELNADISGNSLEIGVNSRYFLDAVKASECDKIKIRMNTPISPIIISPVQGESFMFLVLPIQLIN